MSPSVIRRSAPLPAEQAGFVTFGSLHTLQRLNRGVLDTWCALLRAVPSARLLIFRHTLRVQGAGMHCSRKIPRPARGSPPDRIDLQKHGPRPRRLCGGLSPRRHSARLDTFPWSGHSTGCQSLWMGVPVVTLRGGRFASRMMASVVHHVGLPHLIGDTRAYVEAGAETSPPTSRASLDCAPTSATADDWHRRYAMPLQGSRAIWKRAIARCGKRAERQSGSPLSTGRGNRRSRSAADSRRNSPGPSHESLRMPPRRQRCVRHFCRLEGGLANHDPFLGLALKYTHPSYRSTVLPYTALTLFTTSPALLPLISPNALLATRAVTTLAQSPRVGWRKRRMVGIPEDCPPAPAYSSQLQSGTQRSSNCPDRLVPARPARCVTAVSRRRSPDPGASGGHQPPPCRRKSSGFSIGPVDQCRHSRRRVPRPRRRRAAQHFAGCRSARPATPAPPAPKGPAISRERTGRWPRPCPTFSVGADAEILLRPARRPHGSRRSACRYPRAPRESFPGALSPGRCGQAHHRAMEIKSRQRLAWADALADTEGACDSRRISPRWLVLDDDGRCSRCNRSAEHTE